MKKIFIFIKIISRSRSEEEILATLAIVKVSNRVIINCEE